MDEKEGFVHYIQIFFFVYFLISIVLLLSEFFPNNGSDFLNGQKFQLNGNGKLYVEGKDCIIKLIQPESEVESVAIAQKNEFGSYESIVKVNGKVDGELVINGSKQCSIKTSNLDYKFYPNYSFSSVFYKFLLSFLITSSMLTSIFLIISIFNAL